MAIRLLVFGIVIVVPVVAALCLVVAVNVAIALAMLAFRLLRAMVTRPLGMTRPEETRRRSPANAVRIPAQTRRPTANATTARTKSPTREPLGR